MCEKIKYQILLLFLCYGALASAQSLDQARKLYNDGNYAAAKPVFEKYIKISPKDASYNHWYGVCLYETGEPVEAEKYLLFASTKKVQESFRYLGQLYFLTYRFDESIEAYETYIDFLAKKKQVTDAFDEKLRQSTKAARMLESTEDIQIIDSVVVDKNNLLSAYMLTPESGTVMDFDDFFDNNPTDKTGTVYQNQRGDRAFYSKSTEANGYDLYSMNKALKEWTDEQALSDNINSESNESFPYLLTDGITLYFASDKSGTLGGYDLYVTRFNKNSNTYLNPEQLGMPFNSVYNDYLLVIDEVKGVGWFATDRFQDDGKVVIYTFIPNNAKTPIETDDTEIKRNRAMITSIADSWKEADYSALREKARAEVVVVEKKADFTFTINNGIDYHFLADFKNEGAKNLYIKAQQAKEKLSKGIDILRELREEYAKGNEEKKSRLATAILEAEQKQEELTNEIKELEKQARNEEIKSLN